MRNRYCCSQKKSNNEMIFEDYSAVDLSTQHKYCEADLVSEGIDMG